jgi:hypothetical protein
MNVNTDGLPPEMQARIAEIIAKAQAGAQQPGAATAAVAANAAAAAAPVQRPPSLMDHMIALRQENAQLVQMVQAQGQVIEAVGNAVGQLYSMFFEQSQASTYSSAFQAQEQVIDNDDY